MALLSTDLLFSQWRTQQEQLAVWMDSTEVSLPTYLSTLISHDPRCQGVLNLGSKNYSFCPLCSHCNSLRPLLSKSSLGYGPIFSLGGAYSRQQRTLHSLSVVTPRLAWDKTTEEKTQQLLSRYPAVSTCGGQNSPELHYLEGDPFTINLLLMSYLASFFQQVGLPHGPRLCTGYRCGTGGTLVTDGGSSLNWTHFRAQITTPYVEQYWAQVGVFAIAIAPYTLAVGTPTLATFLIDPVPCAYRYDGVTVHSSFTLHLAPFKESRMKGLTVNDVRYFSKGNSSYSVDLFVPQIESRDGDACGGACFRLSQETLPLYLQLREGGLPLYVSAVEFYLLITNTMCDPLVYALVQDNILLQQQWRVLWQDDDRTIIEQRLQVYHAAGPFKIPPFLVVLEMLRDLWLRCEIVACFFAVLAKGEE